MLTVDHAFREIAQRVESLAAVEVPLAESLGLVLADDIASDIDSPPHDKAMMDGFAVVADDTTSERRIVEEVMAGQVPTFEVTRGSVARVMTGAPISPGANAVVPVEKSRLIDEQTVSFDGWETAAGKHIMQRGTAMRAGELVLTRATRIGPIEMGLLAEVGRARVPVIPRPRVAVLTTGDELVDVSQKPGPGKIRNTNGPLLAGAIRASGGEVVELPVGRDHPAELASLVAQGLDADVLLVTGGVSAGVKDLVPRALAASGIEQVFHKLALKPGKPLWFGVSPREVGPPRLVFGLPGNPVSGLVCFTLFVKPALEVLAGGGPQMTFPLVKGVMGVTYQHRGDRETFRPAHLAGEGEPPIVTLREWQGSADLAGLVGANFLLRLSPEPRELGYGDPVEGVLLPGYRDGQ